MAGYKVCETCAFYGKNGSIYWCFKKGYSTSATGGAFCTYWKPKW